MNTVYLLLLVIKIVEAISQEPPLRHIAHRTGTMVPATRFSFEYRYRYDLTSQAMLDACYRYLLPQQQKRNTVLREYSNKQRYYNIL